MSLCLNMIVRDEARVIARCLASIKPFIDSWCIVDTGSTDGTQSIVRDALAGLPGELLERLWVDQEHNRNEALEAAFGFGSYALLIDADETLECEPDFVLPALTADGYEITVRYGGLEFPRPMIVRLEQGWRWVGRRHPYLQAGGTAKVVHLDGIRNCPKTDGASWRDPHKYARHAKEMERELDTDPGNPRLLYYLAQSYRDAGLLGKALETYLLRARLQGFIEESWSALYEAAKILEQLHRPYDDVIAGYLHAYRYRPSRAEPLYRLARYLRHRGDYAPAMCFAREAARKAKPNDRLFIEFEVYEHLAAEEVRLLAEQLGEVDPTRRPLQRSTAEFQGDSPPC